MGHVHMGGRAGLLEEGEGEDGGDPPSVAALHHGFARQLKPLLAELKAEGGGNGQAAAAAATAGSKHEPEPPKTDNEGGGNGGSSPNLNPSAGTASPLGGLAQRALLQPAMANDPAVRVRGLRDGCVVDFAIRIINIS